MAIPFLHPALLGLALTVCLLLSALAPASWRRWWVLALAGPAVAALAAVAGIVPWTGQLQLSAYGVCLLAAFALAYGLVLTRAGILGLKERQVIDMALIALIAGLVGSRLFEVIDHWPEFTHVHGQPVPLARLIARIADIDGGGMVWYGGALLGSVSIAVYAWRQRIAVLPLADLVLPAVLAALAVGRIGCFFNGCCFGQPTDVPWAVMARPGPCLRHPTQLYEVLVVGLLAALCWWWWRRRRSDGEVTVMACTGYAIWRLLNEWLREDKVMTSCWGLFPASTAQVISIHLLLAVAIAVAVVRWRRRRDPQLAARAHQVPGSIHAPSPPREHP